MHRLSKPELDIGFFTNRLEETLAFWREDIGLSFEDPVYFNGGLVQYRHALGDTVVKINSADGGVGENVAGGYGELWIACEGISEPETRIDPNGQIVHRVPKGTNQIEKIGIEILVDDVDAEREFLLNALGCQEEPTGGFVSGNCYLFLKHDRGRPAAEHWVNAGFRYFTLHVMNVDAAFDKIIENGGVVGERPYAIGDIAKISFVRSPAGNWVEVAQRRELAGAW